MIRGTSVRGTGFRTQDDGESNDIHSQRFERFRLAGEQNPQIKLSLIQNGLHYSLSVGNRVGNKDLKQLTDRIDKLNNLSLDEVKALYSKTIHEGHISEKGGAGLGLMKILRCSREPIKYAVEPIDSESSNINFTISITDQPKQ